MKNKLDSDKPIFLQIKENVEDSIIDGGLQAHDRIPSTNEFAAFYGINPATAAKGINELVAEEIIYKRRGVGMFVAEEARGQLVEKRKEQFYRHYVVPLKQEAGKLEIGIAELVTMMEREETNDED